MNPYLLYVLGALLGAYILNALADWLNVRHVSDRLPEEFIGCYDAETYARSQRYLRDGTRLGLLRSTVVTATLVVFIVAGGFDVVDRAARAAVGDGEIAGGLLFAAILVVLSHVLSIPFAWVDTFVLEARYGFNKTTRRTFVLDIVKELVLTAMIGGPVFAAILWLFGRAGAAAWVWCWGVVVAVQIVILFLAPYVIMPLFNTFTPLEDGPLRAALEAYAREQRFRMRGIYTMDGSKRSGKSNAFFTGFGRSRRIVLFDTLVARHTVEELLAVVAHEMGHYKRGHIPRAILRAVATTGVTFFLMSLIMHSRGLFEAFGMHRMSIHAGLVFFGFLYTPLGLVLAMIENVISRAQEYEADAYAVTTGPGAEAMVAALKKLSVDNLSNLTPHPFKVFLDYSHPPVLSRIRAIRAAAAPRRS